MNTPDACYFSAAGIKQNWATLCAAELETGSEMLNYTGVCPNRCKGRMGLGLRRLRVEEEWADSGTMRRLREEDEGSDLKGSALPATP